MRNFTPEALAHLLAGHLCWNVLIVRRDGIRHAYTSHDQPFAIASDTYSPQNGITPANYQSDLKPDAANSEFSGFFDDDEIADQDVINGALDGAAITLFVCSWEAPPTAIAADQCLILSQGSLGKVKITEHKFTFELLSAEVELASKATKITQPNCDATLGDPRCGVSLSPYEFEGEIVSVTDLTLTFSVESQNASAQPTTTNYYQNGRIEYLSGAASGARTKVRVNNGPSQTLTLLSEPFSAVVPGDRFRCTVGCDKSLFECHNKFNNSDNFRGHPFVPGPNALTKSP